jgi:hypothetical protein
MDFWLLVAGEWASNAVAAPIDPVIKAIARARRITRPNQASLGRAITGLAFDSGSRDGVTPQPVR